jgi:hypothetical protein
MYEVTLIALSMNGRKPYDDTMGQDDAKVRPTATPETTNTAQDAIAQLTKDSTPEFLREFLWRLVDTINNLNKAVRRDLITIVILTCVAELLNRGLISEASAAGIKLAKLGFLGYVLPVAIAYLLFRAASLGRDSDILISVHDALANSAFPGYSRSDLNTLLILTDAPDTKSPSKSFLTPRAYSLANFIYISEALLFLFGTTAICAYFILRLFVSTASPHVGAWVSGAITAIFLALTYLTASLAP